MGSYVPAKAQSNFNKGLFLNHANSIGVHAKSAFLFNNPVKENKDIHLKISPLRHEAFFCRMEDKVHNKLNIWIKLRAGNDELYRKLIAAP